MSHEEGFPSLSLRWFPESFLLCGAGRYPAAVSLAFSHCKWPNGLFSSSASFTWINCYW